MWKAIDSGSWMLKSSDLFALIIIYCTYYCNGIRLFCVEIPVVGSLGRPWVHAMEQWFLRANFLLFRRFWVSSYLGFLIFIKFWCSCVVVGMFRRSSLPCKTSNSERFFTSRIMNSWLEPREGKRLVVLVLAAEERANKWSWMWDGALGGRNWRIGMHVV